MKSNLDNLKVKSTAGSQLSVRRSSFSRITFRDQTRHQFFTHLLSSLTSSIFFSIVLIVLIRLLGFHDQPENDIPDFFFYFDVVLFFISFGILIAINLKQNWREVYPSNLYSVAAFQLILTISISLLVVHVSPQNIYLACYLTLFSFLAVSLIGYSEMVDLSSPSISYLSANISLMCLSIIYLVVSYFVEIKINILPLIFNYFVLVLVHSYIFYKAKNLLNYNIVTLSSSSKAETRRTIVKAIAHIYSGLVVICAKRVGKCVGKNQTKDVEKIETHQKPKTGNADDQLASQGSHTSQTN